MSHLITNLKCHISKLSFKSNYWRVGLHQREYLPEENKTQNKSGDPLKITHEGLINKTM